MSEAAIAVHDLHIGYGRGRHRADVIRGVSFEVAPGESVGVIGETGSGKSTLARALVGLVPAASGDVRIGADEVTRFGDAQWRAFRRRGAIQYVFQDPLRALDPERTIRQSLAEPLQLQQRFTAEQICDRIRFRLEQVCLDPVLLDRFPGELSGGQRQRVLLARALATEPRVLVLDEPVSALDAANRVGVLEVLNELRAAGTALLFISHDLGSVAGVTDRVLVLHDGRIVEDRPTIDVVREPRHPYTRLLVGSAPSLHGGAIDRAERAHLRRLLDETTTL
ncbi:ABC transporter ATP-binding protein [Microbacterium sp. GXF6406]